MRRIHSERVCSLLCAISASCSAFCVPRCARGVVLAHPRREGQRVRSTAHTCAGCKGRLCVLVPRRVRGVRMERAVLPSLDTWNGTGSARFSHCFASTTHCFLPLSRHGYYLLGKFVLTPQRVAKFEIFKCGIACCGEAAVNGPSTIEI